MTNTCNDDPHNYQACLEQERRTVRGVSEFSDNYHNNYPLCGKILLRSDNEVNDRFPLTTTQAESSSSKGRGENLRKKFMDTDERKCNGVCDRYDCLDEAYCNGFRYGFYCGGIKSDQTFISSARICDEEKDCENGEDETGCLRKFPLKKPESIEKDYCLVRTKEYVLIQLNNFTRCSALTFVFDYLKQTVVPICEYYLDQTNCSDPTRGVIPCQIDGYRSTVSKFATCKQTPGLCDDGFDSLCLRTTVLCHVHKHQLCNGISDCIDKSDESSSICGAMTTSTCYRRYRHETKLSIPVAWLGDGFEDCQNGDDEKNIWPICGVGELTRFVRDNSSCEEVFLCSPGSSNFVKFQDLCNGLNTCGHARICFEARSIKPVYTNPVALRRENPLEFLVHCVAGVSRSLGQFFSPCVQVEFTPFHIFGLVDSAVFIAPKTVLECTNYFGKAYVYLSCSNKCQDHSRCPLKLLKHDSCMNENKYEDRRFTLNMKDTSQVTFLYENRKSGNSENRQFNCKNDRCVGYEKVCNLFDDCLDGSDEEDCTNNFECKSKKRYIAHNQKCDGRIDCVDFSDECNEKCTTAIIANGALKAFGWFLGCAAVILNSIKLFKNFKFLATRNFTSDLINKALTTVVHVGDMVTGSYLLAISIVDSFIYGTLYCKERARWLSSGACAFLGVFSTFGAQISLFSMTFLSIFRALGVIRVKKYTSKYTAVKMIILIVTMALVSFCFAYTPLMDNLEDFFVNGMTYNPNIKLFSAFVNKNDHIQTIKSYYGRISISAVSSWKKINSLIDGMFSQQYDGIGRRTVHFYGNDGVCLFKYFVSRDDPQKMYVWASLLLNLLCFSIMFTCYTIVIFSSKRSRRNSSVMKKQNEAQNKLSRDKDETQQYVALIILTDFVCWIPFITVCIMHFFDFIDGTALYPISSIVILPINSVINPILYNDSFTRAIKVVLMKGRYWVILFYTSYSRELFSKVEKMSKSERKDKRENRGKNPQTTQKPIEHLRPGDEPKNIEHPDISRRKYASVEDLGISLSERINKNVVITGDCIIVHRERNIAEEEETIEEKDAHLKSSIVEVQDVRVGKNLARHVVGNPWTEDILADGDVIEGQSIKIEKIEGTTVEPSVTFYEKESDEANVSLTQKILGFRQRKEIIAHYSGPKKSGDES